MVHAARVRPVPFSQRVGRTPAQRRRAAKAAAARRQERQSRHAAKENTKHVMGEVSGYLATDGAGWNVSPAKASVIKFAIEDWINSRTLDLAVPRDQASPGLWDLLASVRDGAAVKADFPGVPGSSGTGEFSLIWNAGRHPRLGQRRKPGNDPGLGPPRRVRLQAVRRAHLLGAGPGRGHAHRASAAGRRRGVRLARGHPVRPAVPPSAPEPRGRLRVCCATPGAGELRSAWVLMGTREVQNTR